MILGGKVTKVSVEKLADGNLKSFSVNVDFTNVEMKDKVLTVSYTYALDYQEKLAKLEVRGEMYYQADERRTADILSRWSKSKELDPQFAEEALNAITHTCKIVGTLASFAVGIPAPIESNKLTISKEGPTKKAG